MSSESVTQAIAEIQQYEFPYCDGAHEDAIRDGEGNAILIAGRYRVSDQCGWTIEDKRPGCLHFNQTERGRVDPILRVASMLASKQLLAGELLAKVQQYKRDLKIKGPLDKNILTARVNDTLTHDTVPPRDVANANVAPYVQDHRAMVDRMRDLCTSLLKVAHEVLLTDSK